MSAYNYSLYFPVAAVSSTHSMQRAFGLYLQQTHKHQGSVRFRRCKNKRRMKRSAFIKTTRRHQNSRRTCCPGFSVDHISHSPCCAVPARDILTGFRSKHDDHDAAAAGRSLTTKARVRPKGRRERPVCNFALVPSRASSADYLTMLSEPTRYYMIDVNVTRATGKTNWTRTETRQSMECKENTIARLICFCSSAAVGRRRQRRRGLARTVLRSSVLAASSSRLASSWLRQRRPPPASRWNRCRKPGLGRKHRIRSCFFFGHRSNCFWNYRKN